MRQHSGVVRETQTEFVFLTDTSLQMYRAPSISRLIGLWIQGLLAIKWIYMVDPLLAQTCS